MRRSLSPAKGFTIVELLIVIVVIAILAAITVVSYNGITSRARYTQIAQVVNEYVKVLALYKIDHGQYPAFGNPGMTGYCIGKGYPNYDSDPQGDCINDMDFADFNFNENDDLNADLAAYFPQLATVQAEGFEAGGHRFNGLSYLYDPNIQVDGAWAPRSVLFYYLPGQNQDCQVPVLRYTGSGTGIGDPSDYIFSTNNPNRWTYVNDHATACVKLLID